MELGITAKRLLKKQIESEEDEPSIITVEMVLDKNPSLSGHYLSGNVTSRSDARYVKFTDCTALQSGSLVRGVAAGHMDIYIWLFLLLSGCCHGLAELVSCPSICRCHPEGQIICQHRWFDGPLNPYFFRVVRNASVQLEIHMDHNKITHIPRRVFENFSSLRNLNLNDNLINTLDPEAFYGLKQLRFLDIRNNSITELPVGLFAHQARLVSLDLRQNSIIRIDLETISPLVSLDQLALGDNPLVCNCYLKRILCWVASRNVSEGDDPITCLLSDTVRRTPWTYLNHLCLQSCGSSFATTTIPPLRIPITLSSSEAPSSKPGRTSRLTEETALITNESLYKTSVMPNVVSAIPRVENMTHVTNMTMSASMGETHGIVTFVVVTTALLILFVFVFVMCRRRQKNTRFKVVQDENTASVPPPGRGQELLCDNDDEEEGYEYVDLGKDGGTARYINLNQENDVLKK